MTRSDFLDEKSKLDLFIEQWLEPTISALYNRGKKSPLLFLSLTLPFILILSSLFGPLAVWGSLIVCTYLYHAHTVVSAKTEQLKTSARGIGIRTEANAERALWFNSLLSFMWDKEAGPMMGVMLADLEKKINRSTPSFVKKIQIKDYHIGDRGPVIEHITKYSSQGNTMSILFRGHYNANMEINLNVKTSAGFSLPLSLQSFSLFGDFQLDLTVEDDHVIVTIMLISEPSFDLSVFPLGSNLNLTLFPGLSSSIKTLISDAINKNLVAPNKIKLVDAGIFAKLRAKAQGIRDSPKPDNSDFENTSDFDYLTSEMASSISAPDISSSIQQNEETETKTRANNSEKNNNNDKNNEKKNPFQILNNYINITSDFEKKASRSRSPLRSSSSSVSSSASPPNPNPLSPRSLISSITSSSSPSSSALSNSMSFPSAPPPFYESTPARTPLLKSISMALSPPSSSSSAPKTQSIPQQKTHRKPATFADAKVLFAVTPKVIEYIENLCANSEVFLQFPRDGNAIKQFEINPRESYHAKLILEEVEQLAGLRYSLCPEFMQEHVFWYVYFSMIKNKVRDTLSEQLDDVEEEWKQLQQLKKKEKKRKSKSNNDFIGDDDDFTHISL